MGVPTIRKTGLLFEFCAKRSNSTLQLPTTSGTNGTFYDTSGNALNATGYSGATWNADGSYTLDGTDDYFVTGAQNPTISNGYSLEAWIVPEDTDAAGWNQIIMQKPYTSHNAPYYLVLLSVRGGDIVGGDRTQLKKCNWHITAGGTRYERTSSADIFNTDTLVHVVLTVQKSTGTVRLYKDGTLNETWADVWSDNATLNQYSTNWYFGRYGNNVGSGDALSHLAATYYVARAYDAVLSADEVAAHYAAGKYASAIDQDGLTAMKGVWG